jgi:carboxyl-terminal processing protease
MWKRFRDGTIGLIVGTILTLGILGFSGAVESFDFSRVMPFSNQGLWLMKQARAILETYHVDSEERSAEDDYENELVYGAIRGMVSAWGDPYSRYADPEQMKEEEIDMEGEYGGLGIYIGRRDGRTLIISPIEDTPADRVGLKPGDEIVKIGDEVILGWDQNEVVKELRGAPGTDVTISVRREGEDNLLDFTIVREKIQIHTVKRDILADDIGYIRLTQFNLKTAGELEKALDQLIAEKVKGLVLDLRNNPGGLLNSAVDVSSMFLDGGLVVGMKGRVDRANEVYEAAPGTRTDLPIVVLINEGSASASEIVAGALHDRERAVIMGKKSFGKGSVQTLFNLPGGSGLFVTIARYYTPDGTMIDHVGLEPDIVAEGEPNRDHDKDEQLQSAVKHMKSILGEEYLPVDREVAEKAK